MKKLADLQGVFEVGKMVVMITMIAVIVTEALTLMTALVMLINPMPEVETFQADLGNTLSAAFFGVSNIIMMVLANRFFKDVVNAGTPFTEYCAQQLKKMSSVCLISQGVALAASYVVDFTFAPVPEARLTSYGGLVLGVVLYVGAQVLGYGAMLEEKSQKQQARIVQLQQGTQE